MKEVLNTYIQRCAEKFESSAWRIFIKAILAGLMIALGAACSSVAAHSITNVGLSRLSAAVVFPMGLMMVVLSEAELFTGDCLAIMSIATDKQNIRKTARLLCLVYVGNFLGAVLTAGLICVGGQLEYSSGLLGAYTIKVALGKVNMTFLQAVTSGVLCNILVCMAVLMAGCAKDVTGKLLACFFMILLFVTGGFEHCVANMYYIPAGMMAMQNPEYLEVAQSAYGISAEQLQSLHWGSFLYRNLFPVTIGNIIGGAGVVGLPLFFLNQEQAIKF